MTGMVLSWDQRWLSSHLCLQRESMTVNDGKQV